MSQETLLEIKNLSLGFGNGNSLVEVLHEVSFQLHQNEILGVVGESGSGKSVTSLAVLGLLPKKTVNISSGSIRFHNEELLHYSEKQFRNLRGNRISMIFQEPMSSLNPSMRCGEQVAEILKEHTDLSSKAIKNEVISLFEKVRLPNPSRVFRAYPHEISGGQKQRVMIAMAIACKPEILIADEPTTALDVTVQKEILNLLKDLQRETKMSIIFISHDLALVSNFADRVVVMFQGKVVEQGTAQRIFKNPQEEYTKALIYARPATHERRRRLPTVADFMNNSPLPDVVQRQERVQKHNKIYEKEPLLKIINTSRLFVNKMGFFGKEQVTRAVDDVTLEIYEGETLGLVGESGCGKSTLGNLILQLDRATSGTVFFRGSDITKLRNRELRKLRKDIQIIFQDPYSSLNPRLTVGQAITEAMQVHKMYGGKKERKEKAISILKQVGLTAAHFDRYPHEFSGGQRQRIGIARTVAVNPKFIVCDESVSALDISVQAQVLNLLNDLKETFGFTYLFISHDLAVVKYIADRIIVMRNGQIVERGEADAVFENPTEDYTRDLIKAIP
ncbi:MAG: ABC transporter ATP-binding protein [Leeuwenhoekiella sp.]